MGRPWEIAVAAKSLQSCPTLCDPIDGSPPGSAISGILQARTLEWAASSFSNAWKWKVKVKSLSRVRPLATPWTAAYQAPPSMGFSRQEYWCGLSLPSLETAVSRYISEYRWWCPWVWYSSVKFKFSLLQGLSETRSLMAMWLFLYAWAVITPL